MSLHHEIIVATQLYQRTKVYIILPSCIYGIDIFVYLDTYLNTYTFLGMKYFIRFLESLDPNPKFYGLVHGLPEPRHQADDLQDLRRVTMATDLQVGAVGPNPR